MQGVDVTATSSYAIASHGQWLLIGLDLRRAVGQRALSGKAFLHERVDVDTEIDPAVTHYDVVWDSYVHLSSGDIPRSFAEH